MAKQRKQDLGGPDEEALEQRVHDMLDITVPDEPNDISEPAPTDIPKEQPSSKKVTVSFADETTESSSPPAKEKPTKPDDELAAVIAATNEQLDKQTATAPLVPSAKPSKPKKVTIEHIQEEELPGAADEVPETDAEPAEPEESPPIPSESEAEPAPESPLEPEIESVETDKAVSDIIAQEGDVLLEIEDEKTDEPSSTPTPKKGRIRRFFSAWVHSSAARWATFLIIFGGAAGAALYSPSRYYLLNRAGVTSQASITITDQSTLRPLKNVSISIAGKSTTTDEEGKAHLTQLPLGPTELVIEKRAFASVRQDMTVGWGSNPLSDVALKPQGTQYTYTITDFLSGKPLTDVEASVGELTATANEKGEIKLTLDKIEADKVTVTFKAGGYKDTTRELELKDTKPVTVAMVPAKQVAFVSKRSGKYDLYKIDADGKNESIVLAGTGNESADITLLTHPTESIAMLVSTRLGSYTSDGKLQNNLVFVNLADGTNKAVTASTQIRAIDLVGTRLVYVSLNDNVAADDPARYKLMSYDYISGDNRQLAVTNYFNSVMSAGGKIYYAPASAAQNGVNLGVFEVHADGSGKRSLIDQESWNMIRTAYDTITLAVQQDWYRFTPGPGKPEKLAGQPSDNTSRVYVDSPDNKYSAWIDSRDGKGVVVLYDTTKKSDTTIITAGGITGPVRWLNNATLVYRVTGGAETADYAVSINGGSPKKVIDVTSTAGISRWSY